MDGSDKPAQAVNQIDLNAFAKDADLELVISPTESDADAKMRRIRELSLFFFALVVVATIVGISVLFVVDGTANPIDQKWAMSFLSGTASALVGFLVGKKK